MERREVLVLHDEQDRRSFETAPLFGACTARELEVLIARGMKFGNIYADPPWLYEPRDKHSAKPERIREIVEKVSPEPRLELFARRITQDWVCWGNEIERSLFDQQAAVKEIC